MKTPLKKELDKRYTAGRDSVHSIFSIGARLEEAYKKICTPDFIKDDPLQFPRRFKKRQDIEIASFLTATIAWGRRDMIIRSAHRMFDLMDNKPFHFIMSDEYKKLKNRNIHRTFFESDLKYYCCGLKHCYTKYNTLEKLFLCALTNRRFVLPLREGIWNGLKLFRGEIAFANKGKYSKHISDPEKSACKRLNLALRWLVRKGPCDLGLWKKIKSSELYIPLDVHVARTARKFGLLQRKSDDKKAVIELTENLRKFCPEDPVKYDFALFGISAI